jgi:hypothetical protein
MTRIDLLSRVLVPAIVLGAFAGMQDGTEAQPQPSQSIFETQYSCRASGPEGSLRKEDLTVLGFLIGTSTIRDVQNRFPGTHPVKLGHEDSAEEGICIKNDEGTAAVFATGVMGAPDTLVAIYLAPVRLVEGPDLVCKRVRGASKMLSSGSGIRVGATSEQLARIVRGKIPTAGPFCIAYQIVNGKGPLQLSKDEKTEGHDFTGAEGDVRSGKLEWVKLFGIASD